jgi:trehalose synthase
MALIEQVPVGPRGTRRFIDVLTSSQAAQLRARADDVRDRLAGRVVWNVNTAASGGGVAEMLHSLVAYACGSGIDCRWCVLRGDQPFFEVTKRIHNRLHGSPGDGGSLDAAARRAYERVLASAGAELRALVGPGDFVILHDPQTAGLVPVLEDSGAHVVWRPHVGTDRANGLASSTWSFLLPYVDGAKAFLFSRAEHVWDGLDRERVWIVPPGIDAFSPKNLHLSHAAVDAILGTAGILPAPRRAAPVFTRRDGTPGRVSRRAQMFGAQRLDPALPIVCQVSRWDRLKDPLGVIRGFVDHVLPAHEAQLVLAGPAARAVADDPEGIAVLEEVRAAWMSLERQVRRRVALVCLPMDDAEENAAIVNALQRRSSVIVQKSLAEGFGLTVSEGMWKGRPLVASRVGGIQDQIEDGVSGLLLHDPVDLAAFGHHVGSLLHDPSRARRLGLAARERVREHFLATRELAQHADLLEDLLAAEPGQRQLTA